MGLASRTLLPEVGSALTVGAWVVEGTGPTGLGQGSWQAWIDLTGDQKLRLS